MNSVGAVRTFAKGIALPAARKGALRLSEKWHEVKPALLEKVESGKARLVWWKYMAVVTGKLFWVRVETAKLMDEKRQENQVPERREGKVTLYQDASRWFNECRPRYPM